MQLEGTAASILQKSLSTSRMVAGGLTQAAGVRELPSPARSATPAPFAAKPAGEPVRDSVKISPEARAMAQTARKKEIGTDGGTPSSSLAIDDSETDGGNAFRVEEGGFFDPRTRAYTSAPAASAEPALLDLFG